MVKEAQRREMVRVDDTIEISHRLLTDAERDSLDGETAAKTARSTGLESLESIMNQVGGRSIDPNSPTWRALTLIDKKLDHIIFLLGARETAEEVEFHRAEVNISGTGLRFPSRQVYKKGDLIWLAMILPHTPPIQIEAFAEVLRAVPLDRKHTFAPGVEVSSKFLNINPQDTEEILRYAFLRQREQLRTKRESEA